MGRKLKVIRGLARTTLLRPYQIQQVEDTAERLGCDFSDVIRASLDLLFPPSVEDLRARTLAAVERNYRRLREFSPDAQNLVIRGWMGQEMLLPTELAKRPVVAGLLEETANMLTRLNPIVPGTSMREVELPRSPFTLAVDELLDVLASPAVRILEFGRNQGDRPDVFLIASTISPPVGKRTKNRDPDAPRRAGLDVAEAQYEAPGAALLDLIANQRVKDVTEEVLGRVKSVLRCSAFAIEWKRCGRTA